MKNEDFIDISAYNLHNLCKINDQANSAQLLEHFRDKPEGNQLAKLMCWQHHVGVENAEEVFLDSIEKLLNSFVEQRTEVLLQKERNEGLNKSEKQELHVLLCS